VDPRAAVKRPATGEIRNGFLPSSPSSPAATTPLPEKTTKNTASKSVAAFLSLFSVRLLFLQICQIWSRALHAPPTDQACGWLDRQLSSSHFISATAVLSTAVMVVRSAPIQTSVFSPFFTILWPSFSFPHYLCNELLEKGRCCCWPVDGGPLLREEEEAKGEQLRYGRLWLALGLRGRPMNGGFPLASLVRLEKVSAAWVWSVFWPERKQRRGGALRFFFSKGKGRLAAVFGQERGKWGVALVLRVFQKGGEDDPGEEVAASLGFKGGRCREDESSGFLPFGRLQGRKGLAF